MRFLLLLSCLASTGCLSGLGAGDSVPIRFYSVAAPTALTSTSTTSPALRVRRVTSAQHLRERMVWRADDVEYGFYESRRWTELPTTWVEDALGSELASLHGIGPTERVSATTLDVNLIGFEELLAPHQARVALELQLENPAGDILLTSRVERRVDIGLDDGAEVARAMREALHQVTVVAAGQVAEALAEEK